jgi:hypothetical protein
MWIAILALALAAGIGCSVLVTLDFPNQEKRSA